MSKQEFLKQIKTLVNAGKIVRVFKGTDTHGITLWVDNPKYIMFQSFGQSAIKNNLKDLAWIIYDLYVKSDIVNDYTKEKNYTCKVVQGVYS